MIQAATLSPNQLADNRIIPLPGLTVTVQQMLDALEKSCREIRSRFGAMARRQNHSTHCAKLACASQSRICRIARI